MDRETIKRLMREYEGNEDVQALIHRLTELELKLQNADILAMTVDVTVARGCLDARSLIGDARLDYGAPWKFSYVPRKILLAYKGGLEEVRQAISED